MNIVYHSVIIMQKIGITFSPLFPFLHFFITIILSFPCLSFCVSSSSFLSLFLILWPQDFRMISLDLKALTWQWDISEWFLLDVSIISKINLKEIHVPPGIFKFSLLPKKADIDKDIKVKNQSITLIIRAILFGLFNLAILSYDFQNVQICKNWKSWNVIFRQSWLFSEGQELIASRRLKTVSLWSLEITSFAWSATFE